MKAQLTLLIADRNSRVRKLLQREMTAEGYQVRLAQNGREVIKGAYAYEPLDLIILDPDLPDSDALYLLKQLQDRIPKLPIVVHAFASDYCDQMTTSSDVVFVEKCGDSVERLKKVINDLLRKIRSPRTVAQENKIEVTH
jgi:DNA-binding NtrC family response regulator